MATLLADRIDTPVGDVIIAVLNDALVLLDFADNDERIEALLARHRPADTVVSVSDPSGITTLIRRYFDGDIDALDSIAVEPGGTGFRRSVWLALRSIPAGTTATYGELAAALGQPKASRAVGAANGANPVGIVLPCHRVIGAKGHLTGYAGGLERKRWLLRHEGALLA